ncbi:MAG: histidine phosphatase family protein [Oscillospiraceae bacterium]|nr:histidine phosphatase family protein [Oscillospiraceae bacterium]MDD6082827.1 histidine phosphatase family protein [Oscillospiraceae bacterium]
MKGYRLYIIRHGQTEANEKGIYIGKTDFPLSDKGRNELVEKLDEYEYPGVERVYLSPAVRCVQTSYILFKDRESIVVNDLRELDFGEFDGKSVEELINRDDYKAWLKGGMDNSPPGGESIADMITRVYSALDRIILNMMDEDLTTAAIVTHSGIIANMLSCFGLPKYKPDEITCKPGEGFEILVTAQLWQQAQAFEILGRVPFLR